MEGVFVPFTRTPSANRTRDGLCFNLAFFAAVKRDDFRVACFDGGRMIEMTEDMVIAIVIMMLRCEKV